VPLAYNITSLVWRFVNMDISHESLPTCLERDIMYKFDFVLIYY